MCILNMSWCPTTVRTWVIFIACLEIQEAVAGLAIWGMTVAGYFRNVEWPIVVTMRVAVINTLFLVLPVVLLLLAIFMSILLLLGIAYKKTSLMKAWRYHTEMSYLLVCGFLGKEIYYVVSKGRFQILSGYLSFSVIVGGVILAIIARSVVKIYEDTCKTQIRVNNKV